MRELILVLCWLGVVQSVLLGVYFLSISKKQVNYFFLGLLLLMVGIRLAKSTLYLFIAEVSLIPLNIGFAAHALLGPLFLFYIKSLVSKGTAPKYYFIHFIPGLCIAALSAYLEMNTFWYRGGYSVLLIYTTVYLAYGWWFFIKNYKSEESGRMIIILLAAISIFQISYFSNYILRLTPYEAGPILHSIIIYVISFLVLKNNDVFGLGKKRKYNNVNLTKEDIKRHSEKILTVMSEKRPYLDPEFSLAKLSELTGISNYILSYILSESIQQNFLQFINGYRVNEAKHLLTEASKQHLSIAAIAYECGFNTLSSFNTAFKKHTSDTPASYRKANSTSRISPA